MDGLTAALDDPAMLQSVESISICRSWPEAAIRVWRLRKKKPPRIISTVYRVSGGIPERRDHIKIEASLDPAMLQELAKHLAGFSGVA